MAELAGERRSTDGDFAAKLLDWAGAYTILFVGLAHLLIVGEHFLVATYLGVLFLTNCIGAVVVAAGLYLSRYTFWAWLLGDLIAGGAFVGFIASRTIGLPDATEFVGQWLNIAGLLTLGLDGFFLLLSLLALTPQGRTLITTIDQKRLGQADAAEEKAPKQKAPGQIEREMSGIRSQVASDLLDLRKRVGPQAVKERVERSIRERLRDVAFGPLGPSLESQQGQVLQPGGKEQVRLVLEAGRAYYPFRWVAQAAKSNPRSFVILAGLAAVVAALIRRHSKSRNG